MNRNVSWDDYGVGGDLAAWGFGGGAGVGAPALYNAIMSDPEIVKALEQTGALPKVGPGINALGVEDLTPVLASAEIQEQQLYLWRDMPKAAAWDMVIQGARLDNTNGNFGINGFIGSHSAGVPSDPRFTRYTKEVKFMGVVGQVMLPTQLTRVITFQGPKDGGAMQLSEELAMLTLLKLIERALPYADSTISSNEFDGICKWVGDAATASNNIRLDLRGKAPDKDFLENLTEISAMNSASPNTLHIPLPVRRDLRQAMFPQIRTQEGYMGDVGIRFDQFMIETLGGDPSTFLLRRNQMLTPGVKDGLPLVVPTDVSPNAPTAPAAVAGAGAAHTATNQAPGIAAGTYYYSVTAVSSEGGRSAATASAGIACTVGQKIALTITDNDSNVEFYEIFRNAEGVSGVSSTNRRFMCRVARTGNITSWDDTGYWLPDTSQSLFLSMNEREIRFRQLLPVMKRQLPPQLMGNSFGILLFGTLEVPVPTHHIWITNIGKRPQDGVASTYPG